MNPVEIFKGNGPVILSQPHGGTFLTPEMTEILNKRGCEIADTDWHIHRLYDGLLPEVTVVEAKFSRYLIDANRDLPAIHFIRDRTQLNFAHPLISKAC